MIERLDSMTYRKLVVLGASSGAGLALAVWLIVTGVVIVVLGAAFILAFVWLQNRPGRTPDVQREEA